MSELLALTERVRNTISLGESHFREFKSALDGRPGMKKPRAVKKICEDIGETLIGFANADGGELLVGVEDDMFISGVPHGEPEIRLMLASTQTHVMAGQKLPLLNAAPIRLDGKSILYFSVAKGTTEVYQLPDGTCLRRKEKETLPSDFKAIHFARAEVRSREYDREYVDGALVTDLSQELLASVANSYMPGIGVERYLQQIGLAEYAANGLRLRRAALLLYARDIQRWAPHSQVRILRVNGTELKTGEHYNVAPDESVSGNISELLGKAWQMLRPFLAYKTEFGTDAKFEQRYIYPELACQEALINAIAHRDYSSSSGIEVYIYDNRLEIRNPGAVLSTLSIVSLLALEGAHESRNALVAKVLRENNKVMRELGEGMRRMFDLMFDNELSEPVLKSSENGFSITLGNKSAFSSQQEQWLLMFQQFTLTPLQKRILVTGIGGHEISPDDIYAAMGTNDRDTYDREVTSLRIQGLLEQTKSSITATKLARSKRVGKGKVARFRVTIPSVAQPVTAAKTLLKTRVVSSPASKRPGTRRVLPISPIPIRVEATAKPGPHEESAQPSKSRRIDTLKVVPAGSEITGGILRLDCEKIKPVLQTRRVGDSYFLRFARTEDLESVMEGLRTSNIWDKNATFSPTGWPDH